MLPNLSANYSTTGNTAFDPFIASETNYNTQTYGFTLAQPIFHPELWAQLEQTRHLSKKAFAAYLSSVQDLIIRVAEQYFEILAALDNYDFSIQQRKGFARELEQTQQRFEVGLIAITDVQEAKARYDNALALEIAAQNNVYDQYEILRQITKFPIEEVVRFQAEKPLPLKVPTPNDQEEWVNSAQVHNYDIIAAKENAEERKAVIGFQASGHFPKVDLNGNLQRVKNPPPFNNLNDNRTINLYVNVPIFEGGGALMRTQEARFRYDQAMQDLERTRRAVFSNTRQAFRGILSAISGVKALAQAVVSNETALEATQAAYEVGTRTIVDVLNAQTNLLLAQRDYAKSRYDYLLEGLRLKRATGCLTADDLFAVNEIILGKASMANMSKEEIEAAKVRLDKAEKTDKVEKTDTIEKTDTAEKIDNVEKTNQDEKTDQVEKTDLIDKTDQVEKTDNH
jgi:outer membrane protein